MHRPLRRSGRRGLSASILATAICAAPPADAEIFKCFAKDRTPVYQNFPCQFSSIDSVPSSLQATMPASLQAKMPALPVDAGRAKPNAVSVALPVQSAEPEPSLGMAPDEVRTVVGEPLEIVENHPTEGVDTWRYVNRTLKFDRAQGVVVDLQAW